MNPTHNPLERTRSSEAYDIPAKQQRPRKSSLSQSPKEIDSRIIVIHQRKAEMDLEHIQAQRKMLDEQERAITEYLKFCESMSQDSSSDQSSDDYSSDTGSRDVSPMRQRNKSTSEKRESLSESRDSSPMSRSAIIDTSSKQQETLDLTSKKISRDIVTMNLNSHFAPPATQIRQLEMTPLEKYQLGQSEERNQFNVNRWNAYYLQASNFPKA